MKNMTTKSGSFATAKLPALVAVIGGRDAAVTKQNRRFWWSMRSILLCLLTAGMLLVSIACGDGSGNGGGGGGGGGGSDGSSLTWTAVADSPFGTDNINAIAYGNSTFVAVGESGKMATSPDGVTWTAVANSTFGDNYIRAIAFGNGTFVAGGKEGKMATSPDGTTWTAVTKNTFDDKAAAQSESGDVFSDIRVIAYGNGTFVAGGAYGKMATSPDGKTWTAVEEYDIPLEGALNFWAIAYGDGKFVVGTVSGEIGTSPDGTTWTAVKKSTFEYTGTGAYTAITAIAYGNGKFVAGGSSGTVYRMATSPDGTTWTAVKNKPFESGYDCSIAYGSDGDTVNTFVAGGGNKMATSPDGITWTAVTDSKFGPSRITAIAYGNNRFVAGGSYGKMGYSDQP